jgi:hypothetical protein
MAPQVMLQALKPGERRPLGYDEWLVSKDEADHIHRNNNTATVNGTRVSVYFIATWDHVDAVQIRVPGTWSS